MRRSPGLWIAVFFVLLGIPFLRQTGLHYDASFELGAFYDCARPAFSVEWFGRRLPVMVISYLGAFKAWLYLPILLWIKVTPLTLRLPTLLAGAGSVWLFYELVERTIGGRTAIAAALLLATDVTFLITTEYDFGPVAFLHLFLLAGMLLLVKFERTERLWQLAAAFFLFGVALWDKALFVWMLGGLGVATLAVFPRRLWAQVTVKRVVVAAGAMALGAAPLIYYNVATGGGTLHPEKAMSGTSTLAHKMQVLRRTFEGSAFFGFMTEEVAGGEIQPVKVWSRASAGLNHAVGDLKHNGMLYGFVAALCLVPWLWFTKARQAALFTAVYLVVTLALIDALPTTGASIHHVILMWPFPHLLMAIAGTQLALALGRRGPLVMGAVLAAMLGWNLLVMNELFAHLATKGTTALWTDASRPLEDVLETTPLRHAITVDWGYETTMCLLSDGQLPIWDLSYELLTPELDIAKVRWMMEDPRNVFVGHAEGSEMFAGVHARLVGIAADAGLQKQVLRIVRDRNGRARFEVMRFGK